MERKELIGLVGVSGGNKIICFSEKCKQVVNLQLEEMI
jgi:hypothetical protein